jgi:hypothetical protein
MSNLVYKEIFIPKDGYQIILIFPQLLFIGEHEELYSNTLPTLPDLLGISSSNLNCIVYL